MAAGRYRDATTRSSVCSCLLTSFQLFRFRFPDSVVAQAGVLYDTLFFSRAPIVVVVVVGRIRFGSYAAQVALRCAESLNQQVGRRPAMLMTLFALVQMDDAKG